MTLVGSNAVIDRLRATPGLFVTKTMTRKGPVYHYDRTLEPIPREVSGQGWELAEDWK